MQGKKILIAEDDKPSAALLKQILLKGGYLVDVSYNGKEAFEALSKKKYDALLTDWMMPEMDGIELVRKVRQEIKPVPLIIVLTVLFLDDAREHALNSGADDFIGKPYDPIELIKKINDLFSKEKQTLPAKIEIPSLIKNRPAPFYGVCIAASSGGPASVKNILSSLPEIDKAAFFVVQHAPSWALKDMAVYWNRLTKMELILANDGMDISPGKIYLAPGGSHMIVKEGSYKISLLDTPPENHVKPAADPLFRSVAKAFGKQSIGIIVTGMGCDGALGAGHISAAKGVVVVQDPLTALVNSMPKETVKIVPDAIVLPLDDIPKNIINITKKLPS